MSKVVNDQADGLRNLMAQHAGNRAAQMIAVVGSGRQVGASSVTLNLAAALAQLGQEVLLLDESGGLPPPAAGGGTGRWSDVVGGGFPLEDAAVKLACGAWWLSLSKADAAAESDVRSMFRGQVILIDASLDGNGALSPLALQADDVVVVLRPQAASITAAYACIKQLHYAHALQQLRIVINGAADCSEAQRVAGNLAATGSRYLGLALQATGCVSLDPRLVQAQRLKLSVVEAFQTSAAAVDFRRIAVQLQQWPRRVAALPAAPASIPASSWAAQLQPAH
ncbi:putative flagellar biosynthesis protein FlhG [Collimonas arenae]|uniref:Putative flagellar biosynthesis protein FlhG n=1 Tax=Collimonas arenae TaxID=279058 RepID=A0A127QFW6_9BURK|nr:hypothetical protein [Collimonas arenae]AMO98818.1 putative flagellar biosynthesis protein FlhG [Collimonas arenae]AMP08715.1 putative flagellar biosynthesis protein FlhG [Collimonas arenae]